MPYIWVLIAGLIVLAAVFCLSSQFRNYRNRKTQTAYVVVLLIFGLFSYQTYDIAIGPTIFSYDIEAENVQAEELNELTISVSIWGVRSADFSLVVNFVNASLQDHTIGNGTAIRIPITYPATRSLETKISFTIDDNAPGFSIRTACENQGNRIHCLSATDHIEFKRNNTDGSYIGYASAVYA